MIDNAHLMNVITVRNEILGEYVIREPPTPEDQLRPSWDQYFFDIAVAVAGRADCRRRKVGCVIVDSDDHRILATGYNGAHPGGPSCLAGECPRGLKTYEEQPPLVGGYDDCVATHAELNALMFARASCKGTTMYLTYPPCRGCLKSILSAGVKRVVWSDEDGTLKEKVIP